MINKSALITILGAALLGTARSKLGGSASNPLRSRLKVAGFPDGMIHVIARVYFKPMSDARNQGGVYEMYLDLADYINPAIEFIDKLRETAKERNLEDDEDVNDIVDEVADAVGVELYDPDEELVENGDVDALPSIPEKAVVESNFPKYKINEWDINERVIEWRAEDAIDRASFIIQEFENNGGDLFNMFSNEGLYFLPDELGIEQGQEDTHMYLNDIRQNYENKIREFYENRYEIDSYDFDSEMESLMEETSFKIDFAFDPARYPWMMEWSKDHFETEIKSILSFALGIYHGEHNMSSWRDCNLGEIERLEINFKELSKPKSELRRF